MDRESFDSIESGGRGRWLAAVRKELIEQTYRPEPVRRVMIPKPGGGERGLGIPNVVDRVVQQAVHRVLSPNYDPTYYWTPCTAWASGQCYIG